MLRGVKALVQAAAGGQPLLRRPHREPGEAPALPAGRGFAGQLYEEDARRQSALLVHDELPPAPRNPPGYSIDDLSPSAQGFYPLREAALRMSASEADTLAMCEQSLLEAYQDGSVLYVRPAIVSVLTSAANEWPEPAARSSTKK